MYKVTLNIAIIAAGLAVGGIVVAGGRPNTGNVPPLIAKVATDSKENAIIITGWNFGGMAPIVRLGEYVLEVKSFSDKQVVARLPPRMEAANYRLTLTAGGKSRITSDVFSAALPGVSATASSAD